MNEQLLADLELVFAPDRKPLFVGKSEGWFRQHGRLLAERSAFLAASECRGLAVTVVELRRDDYWRQFSDDWGQFCLTTLGLSAEWVEQACRLALALHQEEGSADD